MDARPPGGDPYWRPGDPLPGPPSTVPPARGRAGAVVLIAVGLLCAAGLVLVLATALPGLLDRITASAPPTPGGPSVPSAGTTPPTPGGTAEPVRVGDAPADVEVADGAAWTADRDSGTVTRVDATTGATTTFRTGGEPTALVVAGDRVWVWNYSSALTPIGPDGQVGELLRLPADTTSIALSGDTLWYSQPGTGSLGRLDARSGAPLPPLAVGGRPDQIAVDGGFVDVLDGGAVRRFDATTGRAVGAPVAVPDGTSAIVAAQGRRYVLGEDGVAVLGTPGPLRFRPLAGVAVGRDAVWVLNTVGMLQRTSFDLRPVSTRTGFGSGGDVAVGPDGRVWLLDRAAGTVRAVPPA